MRARTSSLRFVSCVEVASNVAGQSRWRFDVALVKCFDAQAETLRFAADFVQRGQPVVNVKRRVLESLRHDRPGASAEI